jgi:predicted Zn-dependent protease with MMP-like domain
MNAAELFAEVEGALEQGDLETAFAALEEALGQAADEETVRQAFTYLDTIAAGADVSLAADATLLKAMSLNQLGAFAEAFEMAQAALQRAPGSVPARVEQAFALFELARFAEVKTALQALERDAPQEPWVRHALGLLAERAGEQAAAETYFNAAAALAPEDFPLAIRMDEQEFDAVVKDALADLPEMAAAHLDKVVVSVEPFPSDDELRDGDLSPTVLGFFRGVPVGQRSLSAGADHAPASIVLFQRNLERTAANRADLIEQIAITVAHEVGHLLGLDEDDLEERGLG